MIIKVFEKTKPENPDRQTPKKLVGVYETQEASINYKTKAVYVIRPSGRSVEIKFDEIDYYDRSNVAELIQYNWEGK